VFAENSHRIVYFAEVSNCDVFDVFQIFHDEFTEFRGDEEVGSRRWISDDQMLNCFVAEEVIFKKSVNAFACFARDIFEACKCFRMYIHE
jgi:hypothetical protein